jgi:hypothetical protein
MTENIAEKIREDRQPEGGIIALSCEAKRLRSSLAVAQKWIEAAREDETGHLALTAEYTRDQLEEELSRIAFRMEVLRSQREWREVRGVENIDEAAHAGALSDALLTAYCILRDVPDEAFGRDSSEAGRERYAHMGALMAAQDAANAEMERFSGKRPASRS